MKRRATGRGDEKEELLGCVGLKSGVLAERVMEDRGGEGNKVY